MKMKLRKGKVFETCYCMDCDDLVNFGDHIDTFLGHRMIEIKVKLIKVIE